MRTTLCALLAVAAATAPATAGHKKPISQTYDVTAPVPYAVDGTSHCTDAPEDLSRQTTPLTLPDRGVLTVELFGFAGDWVLELFDAKGRMIGQAAIGDLGNPNPATRKITYKKATPGQQVTIAACNVLGGPTAKVRYTFTFR